jgi:hypothetical protein
MKRKAEDKAEVLGEEETDEEDSGSENEEVDDRTPYLDELVEEVARLGFVSKDIARIIAMYLRVNLMLDIRFGFNGGRFRAFQQKFSLGTRIHTVGYWVVGNRASYAQRRWMNPECPYTVNGARVDRHLRVGSLIYEAGVDWLELTSGKFIISANQDIASNGKYSAYDITFVCDRGPVEWHANLSEGTRG